MTILVRVLADSGEELFNSWTDDVLFSVQDQVIVGGNYDGNRQVVITFPTLAGRRIMPFIIAPYNGGDLLGWAIPSCRVSYNGNIPVVTVFLDQSRPDIPATPCILSVMLSGVTL